MKKQYSETGVIPIKFDKDMIKEINAYALAIGLPRSTLIRRLTATALKEVKNGRNIFAVSG